MKIKVKEKSFRDVLLIKHSMHKKPVAQSGLFRKLMYILSAGELKKANFTYHKIGMERLKLGEPCLVLMNHSSFIDLKIAATLLGNCSFHIVCTSDGFVGKEKLMRKLGCIPTRKFQSDILLLKDMLYTLKELKSSVLMYPEASYSFDGTATPLPRSLGKCLKFLDVPVIMIKTYGAFSRDPLYNNLRIRKVNVSADMEYLFSPEAIREHTADELSDVLKEKFTFDSFKWQQDNRVKIDEPFRADDLNRVLYKCPNCHSEGSMLGKGETITCRECGRTYRLTEYGYLEALDGKTIFAHVPDWFNWQREEVRKELLLGRYQMQVPVDICMMVDMNCIYRVGSGMLTHSREGFHLTGCNGELDYRQKPSASYSLYSDFYWYEIGDVICIGTGNVLYYCFLQKGKDVAAKARLAAEEMYKLTRHEAACMGQVEKKNMHMQAVAEHESGRQTGGIV